MLRSKTRAALDAWLAQAEEVLERTRTPIFTRIGAKMWSSTGTRHDRHPVSANSGLRTR